MPDEKFDLEKYLQLLAAAGLSEAPAGEERTTAAPEQEETEKHGLLARLTRWVRRRASARASAPATDETWNVDSSNSSPDSPSEAQPRTHAQAELPPQTPYLNPDTQSGGNSAVSAAQQPKRANALPLPADAPAQPDPTRAAERPVADTSEKTATPYNPAQPVTDALPPPEPPPAGDTAAPSAPKRVRTEPPPTQPPTPPAAPYRGGASAGSPAAAQPRQPNRAAPPPPPRTTLQTLTRTLDRELRRYG